MLHLCGFNINSPLRRIERYIALLEVWVYRCFIWTMYCILARHQEGLKGVIVFIANSAAGFGFTPVLSYERDGL